jgi:D-aminopeptidase
MPGAADTVTHVPKTGETQEAADTIEHLDFVVRTSGTAAQFTAPDFRAAFERFNALHFLAPTVS